MIVAYVSSQLPPPHARALQPGPAGAGLASFIFCSHFIFPPTQVKLDMRDTDRNTQMLVE